MYLLGPLVVQDALRDRELRLRPDVRNALPVPIPLNTNPTHQNHQRRRTLPYIQPFTNRRALYAWFVVSNWNDISVSVPSGTDRSNVVTKKPTPGPPEGRPSDRSRAVQLDVS